MLRSLGRTFYPLFQASCLNFETAITKIFGESLSLGDSLTYALQFSKLSLEQISQVQKYDLNEEIEAIDNKNAQDVGLNGNEGVGYSFKVSYSLQKSTKGDAHFVFSTTNPDAKKIHQVLVDKVASDELWPHKPSQVVTLVRERTGLPFTSHQHTLAWKKLGVRPRVGSEKPQSCNKKY